LEQGSRLLRKALISAIDVQGVAITRHGYIDGNGTAVWWTQVEVAFVFQAGV